MWTGGLALAFGLSITAGSALAAPDRTYGRELNRGAEALGDLRLATPVTADARTLKAFQGAVDPSLIGATGRQQIIVRLRSDATAALDVTNYANDRVSHKLALDLEQGDFIDRCMAMNSEVRVLGRVQHVLNAVFLDVPATEIPVIAADRDVVRVAPVGHYKLSLEETVPYIGAAAAQASGFRGEGIKVAVLDSGVDYTHADLGGSGDPEDYLANDGEIVEPGTFPTRKVVAGFDFLGNEWPTGPGGVADPPRPDPDPLDDLAFEEDAFAGHGTHVADIIAGTAGVAPDADLIAVKVCASLTPSCNGISLILGMDYAVDPNGDGDTSDRVDIINLSLGADYGQPFDDDLVAAVENASAIGALTVAAAGNCGDQPYCTGTPSAAPSALSVAQSNVPSATQFLMNIVSPPIGPVATVKYTWTPDPAGLIEGEVQYGDRDADGNPVNLLGCEPFQDDLRGKIVAVDRGVCNFSDKIRNIEQAGGVLGIIMLVDDSAPFAGAFGGGPAITIPGFNIANDVGDVLRAGGAVVQFGAEFSIPLQGVTVSSSARGPDLSFNAIKPEIAAPGASISAEVGTGTVRTPFGGTSGASPMVAGAAALVLEQCLDGSFLGGRLSRFWRRFNIGRFKCTPQRLKAQLVNTGFRDLISDTTFDFAEITRIGGGEVRVDDALHTPLLAFDAKTRQPALSLGFADLAEKTTFKRFVQIKNRSRRRQRVTITPEFRFGADAASDAVQVEVSRERLSIPPGWSRWVKVTFTVDPFLLTGNPMNSGTVGNVSQALTAAEYDGYLVIESKRGATVAMPWHILPRQAARVEPERTTLVTGTFPQPDNIGLQNSGAGVAQNATFSLLAVSDNIPRGGFGQQSPTPDLRAVGVNTFIVSPELCTSQFLWTFGISSWERQSHLVPVSYQLFLDTNQDGLDDYLILNRDISLNSIDVGQQLTWVVDLNTGIADALFFAEHATNTGNTVLTVCGEQLGLGSSDILARNVNVNAVLATDFYFGGPGDLIPGPITITPLGERFFASVADIPAGETGTLEVQDFGSFPGNSPELGTLLFTNGDRGPGARGGATPETEALLFLAPGVDAPVAQPPAPAAVAPGS
ncbi:MAG: S8 family serine peptidase [Pseudomonadota bacterium]